MLVDQLAEANGIEMSKVQQKALVGSGRIGDHSVILAKPQTYMNLSGDSVGPLASYYRIPTDHVLVVFDELDLPFGTLRMREQGGAGGHNGMKSIIQHLGNEFPRLRLGIDRPPGQMPAASYVLQDFSKDQLSLIPELLDEAVRSVRTFLDMGVNDAMSRHNRSIVGAE